MPCFVRSDFALMLHGQSNIVEAFQKTLAREIVDGEGGGKSTLVADTKLLEIYFHLILRNLPRPPDEVSYFLLGENHSEHTIL